MLLAKLLVFIIIIILSVSAAELNQNESSIEKDTKEPQEHKQRITETVLSLSPKYYELSFDAAKIVYGDNYIISKEGYINNDINSFSEPEFNIQKENFFIIESPLDIENSNLYLLRYRGINIDDRVVYIDDEIEKRTKEFIYWTRDIPGVLGIAKIVIGDRTYKVYIKNKIPYDITIDLNGDGVINGEQIKNEQ